MSSQFKKQYAGQGVLKDPTLGIFLDWGPTVPSDNTPGYGVGAIWFDTDAADGAQWLRNDGTVDACDFNTITGGVNLAGLTATITEINTALTGNTATAAEINGAADLSARTTVVAAAGGAVTLPANGGVILIPLVTSNVTATLPATPTAGLTFKFVFVGSAADAEDWVITAAAFFAGGVVWMEEDSAGVEVASIYANGTTHNTLTVNNPAAGTYVECIGNGTNWCLNAMIVAADTPAFSAV